MPDVIIRFSADKTLLARSLAQTEDEFNFLVTKFERASDEQQAELYVLEQALNRDGATLEEHELARRQLLAQGEEYEHLQRDQEAEEQRAFARLNALRRQQRQVQVEADQAEEQVVQTETRVRQLVAETQTLQRNLRDAATVVAGISGFANFFWALQGSMLESTTSTMLALATNTLTQAILLQSIAGASGNVALFAIAGALAGNAATYLQSIRVLGEQQQNRYDIARRRAQQRLIK